MKSVEPNTRTSKRSRAEATATTLTSGAIPAAEKVHVDPTAVVESFMTVKPTITPPLSICAMMESFMTTQIAHGQLIYELLTEMAALRADIAEYSSAFPPLSPSDD